MLEPVVLRRLAALPVGPTLGRLLAQVVEDKAHHRLVDLVAAAVDDWLVANREQVIDARRPAGAAVVAGVRGPRGRRPHLHRAGPGLGRGPYQPEHPIRQALDRLLARFAEDLRHDPATIERASGVLESLLAQTEVRRAFGDVISAGRRLLLEMVDDPDGELRTRLSRRAGRPRPPAGHRRRAAYPGRRLGRRRRRLRGHPLPGRADPHDHRHGRALGRRETARKVELAVGRDLQFIRINGTVVGALAGVAIYAVGLLVR